MYICVCEWYSYPGLSDPAEPCAVASRLWGFGSAVLGDRYEMPKNHHKFCH